MNLANAYSRTEAEEIAAYYACLTGEPFLEHERQKGTIECVAVSPFDELNKWIFFHHFRQFRDPVKAMEYYQVPYFDVVIIASRNEQELFFKDIRTYLSNTERSSTSADHGAVRAT